MEIQNILSRYADPTMRRMAETVDTVSTTIDENGSSDTSVTTSVFESGRNILEEYDVTDITPSEFSEMIQRLHDSGAISQAEFEQMAAIRVDLDAAGIDSDESVNLPEFCSKQLQESQRKGDPDATALMARLDWMEKFALIQGDSDALGLDTFA